MDRPPLGLTPEFGVFEALVLVLAGVVVFTVGYDIYQHPVDPQPVGVARVEVSGAGHFRGDIGVEGSTYAIEGEASAAVVVPFTRSDLVVANMQESPGVVRIKSKHETVEEGSGLVTWKVPRGFEPLPAKLLR